ncbi:MAG TPA: Gmad2 immunoglobulin-like domain-containing protein, partial [Patescibacteria group bacterium]|nr:Gmad2 immunoglobulin-like domain-containing protein [Patescibacteria group bacterium]
MAELPQEAQTVWTKNPRLKTLLGILVFVFIFCGLGLAVFARLQAQYRQRLGEEIKKTLPQHQAAPADGRLQVNQPQAGAVVGQAFSVSGVAEGWFEGAIAIKVFDSNNVLLYSGNATAEDNYNRPAPFEAAISLTAAATAPAGWLEFDDYSAKDGSLAYQKKVEISFSDYSAAGWKTYKNDQYGFEFQYPARWQFSSGSIKNVPKLQSDGSWSFSPYVAVGNPLSGMAVYSFYVFVGANPKGQSAPDYVKQMIAAAPADGPDSLKYDKAYPISV